MNKYKRPKIDKEDFTRNPLLAAGDFKILVNKIVDGKRLQLIDGAYVPSEVILEYESYSKVYSKPENRIIVSSLNVAAKSLFLWIMYEIEAGEDYIWINKERYMRENGLSSINTYKRALKELIRLTFVCPSVVKDVYWINPRLIFCGSRINKYPNNVVLYEPKVKQDDRNPDTAGPDTRIS